MAPLERRLSVGWHRRSRTDARLWFLGAVLLAIAAALWVGYAAALPVFQSPSLPWWAYAIAFFATARLASIDSPRRGTQAITMAAAPFVVGLFHATPLALLGGYALGVALAAATRRPWALWQSAFEIVRFAAFAAIAIWAFRLIAGPPTCRSGEAPSEPSPRRPSRSPGGAISEAVVFRPRERASWIDVVNHLRAAYVAAAAAMCIGLIAVRLIPVDRYALVPLAIVTFTVLVTHRAWVRERYDHEAAEFLIGAVDALAGRELEPSIVLLLNRARDIFHAEIAQLTVFPSQPAEKAFRTTVRYGKPDEVMVALGLGSSMTCSKPRPPASSFVAESQGIRARRCSAGATSTRRWSRCCAASCE